MTENTVPINFDWVQARADCSLQSVFKSLELGVTNDVDKMNSLIPPNDQSKFAVSASGNRFSVVRILDPVGDASTSVDFTLAKGQITASSKDYDVNLSATITLNNDGRCKLKVGDKELEQWQFRRMALEQLFFLLPKM